MTLPVLNTQPSEARVARAQYALLGCVFLGLFTEVLLSPFYPQFFRKVFGIDDFAYTGWYIFICRLTVVLCSPLWGLLSRRFDPKRLLFFGQAGTAVFTAMMATADTAGAFLAFTVLLLLFKSSYMLIYPLMVSLSGNGSNAATASKFHAVYHLAIILSTLAGARMMTMENPLSLFYLAAAVDVVQLGLCVWALRGFGSREKEEQPEGEKPSGGLRRWSGFLIVLGSVFFTLTVANNLIRPFFTQYSQETFGLGAGALSLLFLIPNAMAVAAMPLIKRLCVPEKLTNVYVLGVAVMAGGLYLQGEADSLALLVLGRLMYGLFLAITMASLDVLLFQHSSGPHLSFHYSVMVSCQNMGELASPLLASALVAGAGLAVPFVSSAAICILNLALFVFLLRGRAAALNRS
ncbi:MFS transporter [Paenibacillus mucilaginosus]|uniref:MFS transporter n=1 Tax=Paenibacillus mucilaginosus (strain KNP414) TaxID=1036673 RepID=F8FKH5_PAEMK|nr:MFS transporter [Paenibacillus mucilaginosus]AEI45568.1 hypothetical protein KNP414_07056 [Paenibacillus mucilaginosus KNP414]MCG7215316.1 MFS transporter [Paenibacillus mucilaginosus]WDM26979.1 MFS transporter [Paenibacillus mucilaginosus]